MKTSKNTSRVLSMLMALVMVLSLFPTAAFAAPEQTKQGLVNVTMMHESKDEPSMSNALFDADANVRVTGDMAQLQIKVAYPVPAFPNEGADGTVKNVVITYNGQQYTAESDITTKPMMTARAANKLFGLEKGKQYPAQVLTFDLPAAAIREGALLPATAYVNAVMKNDVALRIALADLRWAETRNGSAPVEFGYDMTAAVSVIGDKITGVKLGYDEYVGGNRSYADNAIAGMEDKFVGLSALDKTAIEAVDTVSQATISSDACKAAVVNALGLDVEADLTFGTAGVELKPGIYSVPVSLRNAQSHGNPSKAASAFPAAAVLKVAPDGTATITTKVQPVTVQVGPNAITDMAYDILVYQGEDVHSDTQPVQVTKSTTKPDTMPEPGKDVPTEISFVVPNNHWDGIYMNFTVDAMGPGYPDAWLNVDYAHADKPGSERHIYGEAKVDQFGKYTIATDTTVVEGVITHVAATAKDFISETHKPTNVAKTQQAADALADIWNGIAPLQDNAEEIYYKIMKPEDHDQPIDAVSEATYSAKAIRDAVMSSFGLEYQAEVINVPESVAPGVYDVEIAYYSDVVWHSLVETPKAHATLTVNADKTMSLDFETKSGTVKEPLYILGFNGIYPNNDKTQPLTKEGCTVVMGLSSNDYEDEFYPKGTQVVNHLTIPLEGGLSKEYATNCYLYVPAMKRLNGTLSGVYFENGHFNVDIFAKIYWDGMKKIGDVPGGEDTAVTAVEEKIDAIGEVTLESETRILEARKAYEALTAEQKALVKNLAVLEAAEARLDELKNPSVPTFTFGSQQIVLKPGTYTIPTALMHADHHDRPSMAAAAILGGTLEVQENGDAYVNVKLGPVDAYGMHGWSKDWKIYSGFEYGDTLDPADPIVAKAKAAEIVSSVVEDGETYPTEIRFKLPYTDKDGVYATMFVPVVGAYPNAYLSLDFAKAEPALVFGSQKTMLEPGTYTIPTALMHADHHDRPSMAAAAILGGTLEVQESGDAYVNVKLGPVDAYGMHGWSKDWKIYSGFEYGDTLDPADPIVAKAKAAEIVSSVVEDGETYPTEIRFKLPYTDKDGVYATMFVPVVGAYPNAYLSLDFAKAEPVYTFGSKNTAIGAGEYYIPAGLMNASHIENPSMAASCILGSKLTVQEDGKAFVNVKLGPVQVGTLIGWSSEWKYYTAYDTTSDLGDMEVISKDEQGNVTEVRFQLPYTDKDGVYVQMYVALMGMRPDAYLALDFTGVMGYDEGCANAVDQKIDAIGEVTLESETAIIAARKAYNALTETQKALVTKLEVLTAAEAKLAELKDEAAQAEADKKAAAAVDAKIAAIGEVTLSSESKIKDARTAYNALTEAQKALVTKLEVLTAAEAKLAELKDEAAQAEADKKAAAAVDAKIAAIGEVTLSSESKIKDARTAYNALTETQKALVTKLEVLTAAEAKLAELKKPTPDPDPVPGGGSGGGSSRPEVKPEQPEEPELSFTDVEKSDYYYESIQWAVENKITNGLTDTTFAPDLSCTRAQMVTFLWRAAGCPQPKADTMTFTDVAADAYCAEAVLWAVEQGITKGVTETTFLPNATVTRAQTVTFLWRAAKSPAAGTADFADVPADAYYAEAVAWADKENITNGVTETTFKPDANCTRGQIVTFLYRFYK